MGTGDGAYVEIGGDSKPLVDAAQNAQKALAELSKAIGDLNKQSSDSGKKMGGEGKDGLDQYKFSVDSLWGSVLKSTGAFGGFMVALNSTFGVIGTVVGAVSGAVDGFLQLASTIGGAVVDAVRMASQEIEQLTQQVFELNKSTEQSTGAWRFIYGAQQSQDLMNWTSQFSMKVPYTRQDMLGAVTALGRMGLSEQQVKDYMATIADVGALNPQRDLTQAAWAVQGAANGRSVMLRYDYGITPEQLAQYGYDQSNPQATILPALKAILKTKGLTGSAQWAATNTFWGAESSFVDRLQNFGLQAGGTDLSGNVSKGSMFGVLKKDLTDISLWWDDHSKDITKIADLFSNVLGGAMKTATSLLQGFMDGLHRSGFDTFAEGALKNLGDLLNSKAFSSGAASIGGTLGQGIGTAAKDAGMIAQSFVGGLGQSGAGSAALSTVQNVVAFLSDPKNQKAMQQLANAIGQDLGMAITFVTGVLNAFVQTLQFVNSHMDPQAWLALKDTLLIIGLVIGTIVVAGLLLLLLALSPIIGLIVIVVGVIWLLIHAFEAFGPMLKVGLDQLGKWRDQLGQWALDLVTKFKKWGSDFMQGLIDGIGSKIHDLTNKVGEVASKFNPLKHSTPTEGPLAGDDQWMGHFMDNLIAPLHAGVPRIAAATRQIAATMSDEIHGSAGSGSTSGGGSSYATNTYGGHSSVSNTFHGTSETQMERVAKRVIGEGDLAQNILARRSGGYRPGLFGSLG